MTDQKLYSKFDYEIKAKIAVKDSEPSEKKQEYLLRNMMYLGDFMNRQRIKARFKSGNKQLAAKRKEVMVGLNK